MVKLWIKVKEEDKILNDTVLENEADLTEDVFLDMMSKAADELDISTPVILSTHFENLKTFKRVEFLPRDFKYAEFCVFRFSSKIRASTNCLVFSLSKNLYISFFSPELVFHCLNKSVALNMPSFVR